MDARFSRQSPRKTQRAPLTHGSQASALSNAPVARRTAGCNAGDSPDGADGADSSHDGYGELAKSIADKLDRVPEKYQNFLLRLCESLDGSSMDLAASIFPKLPAARQEQALIALLAAECAGDVFIHDRIGPLPAHLRLARDSRSANRLIPFDGRVFDLADLQVFAFGSENPADLLGKDILIAAWGQQWSEQQAGQAATAGSTNHPHGNHG